MELKPAVGKLKLGPLTGAVEDATVVEVFGAWETALLLVSWSKLKLTVAAGRLCAITEVVAETVGEDKNCTAAAEAEGSGAELCEKANANGNAAIALEETAPWDEKAIEVSVEKVLLITPVAFDSASLMPGALSATVECELPRPDSTPNTVLGSAKDVMALSAGIDVLCITPMETGAPLATCERWKPKAAAVVG